jgi:AcrR family transcriptional regulator
MSMDANPEPKRRGPGRRPGTSSSREVILDAARTRFAKDGYAGSTIRKIAADAGVDASLVMQFFGSKEDLFGAVMSISPSALSRISDAFDGPENAVGERVTRAFLELWDGDPQNSEPLLGMLRAAISNEQATHQLRELIENRLTADLGPRFRDDPDTTTRIEIATSMLIGVIVGRRIVQVDALVREEREALVAFIAPAIQALLMGGHSAD